MAANVLVDTGFLAAFVNRRDRYHEWAVSQAAGSSPPPWKTCEPVLSETFHVVGSRGTATIIELLDGRDLVSSFQINDHLADVLGLLHKYADVPISLADACLVRMTEVLSNPTLLTTDSDFRIYRRHGRQVIPCIMPA